MTQNGLKHISNFFFEKCNEDQFFYPPKASLTLKMTSERLLNVKNIFSYQLSNFLKIFTREPGGPGLHRAGGEGRGAPLGTQHHQARRGAEARVPVP